MTSFEGRLASIYVDLKANVQANGITEEIIVQTSKQYRKIIAEYACDVLPIWHAIELLILRAHSSIGSSSEITWFEFGMALSSFYRKYYYQPQSDPLRQVIARDFSSIGLDCPPGDLRSAQSYLSQWNRWKQLAASDTSDQDLRAVFGGIDYDRLISTYRLDWLEQTLLAIMFYEDQLQRDNWESLYVFIDNCEDQQKSTISGLVKLVLSGKVLACIASLPELVPNDALWLSCHITDLLYYNTNSWLDPSLKLERPLNEHFAEKYAQSLSEDQISSHFFLAMEYLCHSGPHGAKHLQELLLSVNVSDPKFEKCLEIANTVFPEDDIRLIMYSKLVDYQLNHLPKALLRALESGFPSLVDAVCTKIFSEHKENIDLGIEPELINCSPYPLLQLMLDYKEFKSLFSSGKIAEGVSLLSKIIIHRPIPPFLLEQIVTDAINLNILEGKNTNTLSMDALYKLLEDLDRSTLIQDKRTGRLALLRGISQGL